MIAKCASWLTASRGAKVAVRAGKYVPRIRQLPLIRLPWPWPSRDQPTSAKRTRGSTGRAEIVRRPRPVGQRELERSCARQQCWGCGERRAWPTMLLHKWRKRGCVARHMARMARMAATGGGGGWYAVPHSPAAMRVPPETGVRLVQSRPVLLLISAPSALQPPPRQQPNIADCCLGCAPAALSCTPTPPARQSSFGLVAACTRWSWTLLRWRSPHAMAIWGSPLRQRALSSLGCCKTGLSPCSVTWRPASWFIQPNPITWLRHILPHITYVLRQVISSWSTIRSLRPPNQPFAAQNTPFACLHDLTLPRPPASGLHPSRSASTRGCWKTEIWDPQEYKHTFHPGEVRPRRHRHGFLFITATSRALLAGHTGPDRTVNLFSCLRANTSGRPLYSSRNTVNSVVAVRPATTDIQELPVTVDRWPVHILPRRMVLGWRRKPVGSLIHPPSRMAGSSCKLLRLRRCVSCLPILLVYTFQALDTGHESTFSWKQRQGRRW